MPETTLDILQNFSPITLDEMGAVRLMNRIDNKYVVPRSLINSILESLTEDYFVFEIANKRALFYKTLYYDSKDFSLYNRHHSGGLNRYKIRERSYVDSNLSFFEIKFKNNKNDTIKSRIKIDQINHRIEGERNTFLKDISGLDGSNFEPKLWVNYDRITLVSKKLNERATIDLNLSFEFDGKNTSLDDLVIIEAKREKTVKNTVMINTLKNNLIRPGGFSKYCLGIASTYEEKKSNGFKKKFLQIKKIRKDHA